MCGSLKCGNTARVELRYTSFVVAVEQPTVATLEAKIKACETIFLVDIVNTTKADAIAARTNRKVGAYLCLIQNGHEKRKSRSEKGGD